MNVITVHDLDDTLLASFGPHPAALPQIVEGLLGERAPMRLSFQGSLARSSLDALRPYIIGPGDLTNGAPSEAFDLTRHAHTMGRGRIVRLTMMDRGEQVSDVGILQLVSETTGPGGPKVQSVELIWYQMPPGSTLWGAGGSITDEVPRDDAEAEGS
jgi:hypothetical protein